MPLFLHFPVTLTEICPPCFKDKSKICDSVSGMWPIMTCLHFLLPSIHYGNSMSIIRIICFVMFLGPPQSLRGSTCVEKSRPRCFGFLKCRKIVVVVWESLKENLLTVTFVAVVGSTKWPQGKFWNM